MSIASRIRAKAVAAYLGAPGQALQGLRHDLTRRLRGQARTLSFTFDIADPWSYLTAQAVERLLEAYPLELDWHLISAPASDVDPQPAMRTRYAVRDAHLLAEHWGLRFAGRKEADPNFVERIAASLIVRRPAREQLRAAIELGDVLWSPDHKDLARVIGKWGTESTSLVRPTLDTNYSALRARGHYQGAMLGYGGQWYWGLDRMPMLEAALARDLGTVTPAILTHGAAPAPTLPEGPLTLECWFSYRSPYSYLALTQLEDLVRGHEVTINLRGLVPMVARGAKLPQDKKMYIARDAKREADRLGIPFGEICDPLGEGVRRALILTQWANAQGKGLAFARSAMTASWAEGGDLTDDPTLAAIVTRAGLPAPEALAYLAGPTRQAELDAWTKANLADLTTIGLWGVPSFRIGDWNAWGQDRLPMLAAALATRKATCAAPEAPTT